MNGGNFEVIGVAELDRRLRRVVEGATGREWVEGEVSSLKRAPSGHVYFCLKDEREDAVIDCVLYKLAAMRARRHLKEGARLQLLGKATLWAPRGRLQLVGDLVRPAGRGAALEALEQLKLQLAREGLFAVERKRPLPSEPRTIGVVTSGGGAAFHDICSVAFRRGGAKIVLASALVQGEHAPQSLVEALELLQRYRGMDVIIIGRGGGSGEDLQAFNDEFVVRAVARCPVPVVSAVGHEIDFTLCDLAADVRAATPSQAGELVMPDAHARRDRLRRLESHVVQSMRRTLYELGAELGRSRARLGDPRFLIADRQQSLDEIEARLERLARRQQARRRARLVELERRLAARDPRMVLARAQAALGPLQARLDAALRLDITRAKRSLGERAQKLHALSPLGVLARGYAIAEREDGRAVRSTDDVNVGDVLNVRLHHGRLGAAVVHVYNEAGAVFEPPDSSTDASQ